jgi:hypothetical protein
MPHLDGLQLDPSSRISRELRAWLNSPDWTLQELVDWLQGHYLPPVGYSEEPFTWILRGVLLMDERYEAEVKLTERLAILLRKQPDINRFGTRPSEVNYNLIMLCGGLSFAEKLADEIYDLFRRRKLEGEWLGVDLRVALKDALIANQTDERMKSTWDLMLSGQQHDYLPGNEYDGFLGTLFLAKSNQRKGEPLIDAIGKAIAAMSHYLENRSDRRSELRLLIDKVMEVYPGRPTWPVDLLVEANNSNWPDWAVTCLPSLSIRLADLETKTGTTYFLWEPFLAIPDEV